MGEKLAIKGQICYSKDAKHLELKKDSYLLWEDNQIYGVYEELPKGWEKAKVTDYQENVIIPGLVDLHTHAPQYRFRGLGMDLELLDWLNQNTFPEESKYKDLDYAKKAYEIYVKHLKEGATTRAVIFGTLHKEATTLLMDLIEKAGIEAYVGKVNMDRNSPDYLVEASAEESIACTKEWLKETEQKYHHVHPILTPRFIPTCSDELMREIGKLRKEKHLTLQSHLSENQGEIAWVKELCPWSKSYGQAYEELESIGSGIPSIMAHCVYSDKDERRILKENGVYVAHCPSSNANLSSGIAPVRTFLQEGLHVGLGSDVAGGDSDSIFHEMVMAIQVSKLRWRLLDETLEPLTVEEAFYLGTKGGGEFFGKVGSFEKGYEMDAVVFDDTAIEENGGRTLKERLERIIYLSDERHVKAKFVAGKKIL